MRLRVYIKYLNLSKGFRIDDSVRIYKKVIIDNRFGGLVSIGENSEIQDGVIIMTYGGNISIGNNCSINHYSVIYGHGGLTIGNDVLIAGHCMIIPNNHVFKEKSTPISQQGNISKGITIKDNVWIGHGVSILDGVTIGSGAVIAAGSVVNKNVPENKIVGGVPIKILKSR